MPKKATEVFDMMEKFAGYGFNKSHSAAYSFVAYQTAYLKANYTPEFMAAAMTNEMGDTERLSIVLEEARTLGIEMLPPCVNHSQAHFTVEGRQGALRAGRHQGRRPRRARTPRHRARPEGRLHDALRARARNRPAGDEQEGPRIAHPRGRARRLEGHRGALHAALDAAYAYAQRHQAEQAAGMISLFGGSGPAGTAPEPALPLCNPMPRADALKHERDLLGFYVSGHPLDAFALEVRSFATHTLGAIAQNPPAPVEASGDGYSRDRGPSYRFCGLITAVQRRTSKTGKPMAFATLEDYTGQAEVTFFSRELDRCQAYLNVDEAVLIKGQVEVRGGAVRVLAQELLPMWKVRELVREIRVAVDLTQATPAQMNSLRDLCDAHRDGGTARLYFDMSGVPLNAPLSVRSRKYVLDPAPELLQGLARLFGASAVTLSEEG